MNSSVQLHPFVEPRFCSEWSDPTECMSNEECGPGEEFRVRKCWFSEENQVPTYKATWQVIFVTLFQLIPRHTKGSYGPFTPTFFST